MRHAAMKTLRYVPVLLREDDPPKLPANRSASGPTIAGPISAMHGATIDIIFDSSTVSPFAVICRGKNGKRHPIPERKNSVSLTKERVRKFVAFILKKMRIIISF